MQTSSARINTLKAGRKKLEGLLSRTDQITDVFNTLGYDDLDTPFEA